MLPESAKTIDYTWQDYREAILRHRAWLLGPVLFAASAGAVGAFLWPDTYVSEAVLRVSPPAASENFYPSPASRVSLSDRLASMQQSILSRNNLTGMIQSFDLYRRERARLPMEDVIERMRRDIAVSGLTAQAGSSGQARSLVFRVGFSYANRFDAHKVTQSLVSRFMDESAREQRILADSVNQFLRDEFDRAQVELDAAAEHLTRFRREQGSVDAPGLQLQQLMMMESRASAVNASLGRARQEEAVLEAEVRVAREAPPVSSAQQPAGPLAAPPIRANYPARAALQLELDRLKSRYRPAHPDVERLERQLAALPPPEPAVAVPAPPSPPPTVAPRADRDRFVRLEAQLRAKQIEIARYRAELEEVNGESARLRRGLAGAPERLTEFERLTRNQEIARQRQEQARAKLLTGEAASNGNRRGLGETIELVDAAALPELPVSPNRWLVVALAALAGLLAGAGMVALRELGEEAVQTVRQVRAQTALSILASIPLIENEMVLRRRRRAAFLGWSVAVALSLGSIAGAAVYHLRQL